MKLLRLLPFLFLFNVIHAQTDTTFKIQDTTLYGHIDSAHMREAQITPKFPGGPQNWPLYLHVYLKYPKDARKQKIEGTVVLDFTVSWEGGRPKDVKVVKSVFPSIDKEAVKLIENTHWVPAVQGGYNVRYRDRRSIEFKLPS